MAGKDYNATKMVYATDNRRLDRGLRHDLKTMAEFIEVYCRHKHQDALRTQVDLKTHDVTELLGSPLRLCTPCQRLLTHAFIKRSMCPLDPKPACKHCPQHCYHPDYRARMREVMKFSGRSLVLSGRLDYLFRLLF